MMQSQHPIRKYVYDFIMILSRVEERIIQVNFVEADAGEYSVTMKNRKKYLSLKGAIQNEGRIFLPRGCFENNLILHTDIIRG